MNEADPKLETRSYELSVMDRFEAAASYVGSSKTGKIEVNNQLRFYGLFKIVATKGKDPSSSKQVPFWDFEGSAKLKSWKSIWEELRKKSDDDDSAMVQLAATEYIQLAMDLGWSENQALHFKQSSNQLENKKSDQLIQGLKNDQQKSDHELNQDLTQNSENLLRNGSTSSKLEVERDEYGIEIVPGSSTTAIASSNNNGSLNKIGGASVSKLIPNESEIPSSFHTSTGPLTSDDDHSGQPSSLLHDLILDHDHIHLENYLITLKSTLPDPKQFNNIINHYHNGYTPFHLACDQGDLEKVKILQKFGANTLLTDLFDHLTGSQLAQEAGNIHLVHFLS